MKTAGAFVLTILMGLACGLAAGGEKLQMPGMHTARPAGKPVPQALENWILETAKEPAGSRRAGPVPHGAAPPQAPGVYIIPRPVHLEARPGSFTLTQEMPIAVEKGLAEGLRVGRYLADAIGRSTGLEWRVIELDSGDPVPAGVLLTTQAARPELGDEGYVLEATPAGIVLRATGAKGLFRGVQTVLQLLPPAVLAQSKADGAAPPWTVPCVRIEDKPRFGWRGLMVDTSRHFFTKQELLDFIDVMALHKMSTLHWHINDDQGWRLEIRKYPKLTEIGAWRDGIGFDLDPKSSTAYDEKGRYGGFFTQADVKEIVQYAADRFITVVPEIEMPGHCVASLQAYPELACDDPPSTAEGQGERPPKVAYCPGKESTFEILQDILDEVIPLFPGEIVHIGGDECNKDAWRVCPHCQARMKAENLKNEEELQSYFIRRIEKHLNAKGKRLMGWSEIRQGGIAPNAMLMDWIGGGLESARSGHDVVMSPTTHCYLDYHQALHGEFRLVGPYLPLHKVYTFEPIPAGLEPQFTKHILGVQGNLWAESIAHYPRLQSQAYPRACAIAEIGWSPAEGRDWMDFQSRLQAHAARLTARGVNYRPLDTVIPVGAWKPEQMSEQFKVLEWDVTPFVREARKHAFEFMFEGGACRLDIEWAALFENDKEISRDAHPGTATQGPRDIEYVLTLEKHDPDAKYILRASVRSDGGTDSRGTVWMR